MISYLFLLFLVLAFSFLILSIIGKVALHNQDSRTYSTFMLISGILFLLIGLNILVGGIQYISDKSITSNYTYGCNLNCCDSFSLGACIGEGECSTYENEDDCINRAQGCEWITNITCINNDYNLTNTTYIKSITTTETDTYSSDKGIITEGFGIIFLLLSLLLFYASINDLVTKQQE
jgi:hypothetical protein